MSNISCTIISIGKDFLFEVREPMGKITYWFHLLNAITYCNITKQPYTLQVRCHYE